MKTLFTFTGGGLAPALNPTLYGVITAARAKGWRILGGLHGWASLLRNGRHVDLSSVDVEPLKNNGGTILRSSRTNPYASEDGVEQVKEKLKTLGVGAVAAIGGDDTLGAASKLAAEGIPIVGIPKTVDNDLPDTYFTPGFPSAAYYLANFTNEIKRDAAYALSRIFIIEAPGMKAGWLPCAGAFGGADIVLPAEQQISWQHFLNLLSERYKNNGNFAAVVISQETHFDLEMSGFADQQIGEEHGHQRQSFICIALRDKIRAELNVDAKALYPANYVESGKPIALDRDLAIQLGDKAVELLDQGSAGQMVCITRPDSLKLDLAVGSIPLQKIAEKKHRLLEDGMFDTNELLPTQKFFDYMKPLTADFPKFENDDYTKLMREISKK